MNAIIHLTGTLCSLMFTTSVFAQQLFVEERTVMNEESIALQCWTARLDQDMDYCMETYQDFIKDFFNTKVSKRGKGILVAEKTLFPELSQLRLDQRAIFSAETGGTSVSFTFSPGYDIHAGKEIYEDEFSRGEQFVKNFVRYHYKAFYSERIKSIRAKIDSKQKDIESNDKKIERNKKAIADINQSGAVDVKSKTKSDKMNREIDACTVDSNTKRDEISVLENELEFNNVCLRKVEAFE